jgi:two-component system response regulator DesR
VKVLIADDDPHVRSAVGLVLANEPGISIVADCPTPDGLVEQVVESGADVLLVDWDMPGFRRTADLRRLHADAPYCHVVALSAHPEERHAALNAGVVSFMCKYDSPERLLSIIRELNSQH